MRIWVFVLAALVLVLTGCNASSEPSQLYDVKYEVVTGGCQAFVTYEAAGRSVQQETVSSGWSYERTAQSGDFLYVSAQNDCSSGGVQANIYKWEGPKYDSVLNPIGSYVLYKTATSNGAYVIATASGSY